MNFLCSNCAACCLNMGGIQGLPDRGDGACGYLTNDNLCSIYKDRPSFCNVEKTYEMFLKEDKRKNPKAIVRDKKQFYINITKTCHSLIDEFKLNKSYKINLKEYERK